MCEREAIKRAIREGAKLDIDDILSDVVWENADDTACIDHLSDYFMESGWNVVQLLAADIKAEEWVILQFSGIYS